MEDNLKSRSRQFARVGKSRPKQFNIYKNLQENFFSGVLFKNLNFFKKLLKP